MFLLFLLLLLLIFITYCIPTLKSSTTFFLPEKTLTHQIHICTLILPFYVVHWLLSSSWVALYLCFHYNSLLAYFILFWPYLLCPLGAHFPLPDLKSSCFSAILHWFQFIMLMSEWDRGAGKPFRSGREKVPGGRSRSWSLYLYQKEKCAKRESAILLFASCWWLDEATYFCPSHARTSLDFLPDHIQIPNGWSHLNAP